MKYKEGSFGAKSDVSAFLKKSLADLFAGRLMVEEQQVGLPEGTDLEYEVKYKDDEDGGSVVFKISWSNEVPEEAEEEEETF